MRREKLERRKEEKIEHNDESREFFIQREKSIREEQVIRSCCYVLESTHPVAKSNLCHSNLKTQLLWHSRAYKHRVVRRLKPKGHGAYTLIFFPESFSLFLFAYRIRAVCARETFLFSFQHFARSLVREGERNRPLREMSASETPSRILV